MRGANLLIYVDAFAMLGDAVGELARAPMLGLFNLAALFRAGVLDAGEDFLDFVFRRGGANDENQIVQTLFHVMTFFLLFPGAWPVKIVATPCGAGRVKARPLQIGVAFDRLAAIELGHRGVDTFRQNRFYGVAG